MTSNLITVQAEVDADIKHAIETMPHRRRGINSDVHNRRIAIGMLRRAVATVIADDVSTGIKPLDRTLDKYVLLCDMDDDR